MRPHHSVGRFIFVVAGTIAGLTTCRESPIEVAPTADPAISTAPRALPPLSNLSASTTGPVVFIGAGDVASCTETSDEVTTSRLNAEIAAAPDAVVFMLGDGAYATGTAEEYVNCYGPTWGPHKARTRPAPGNRDYSGTDAAGYFGYFGDVLAAFGEQATDPARGYYSYDLGDWHVVVLNQQVSITASSAQMAWLNADLAASPKACTIAYWHNPAAWSTGSTPKFKAVWDALYAAGADIIMNADRRNYERFAPQTPSGEADPQYGIRQFIAGTGGGDNLMSFGNPPHPRSEVRIRAYGLLKLTLGEGTYSWEFLPTTGTVGDQGSGSCHEAPPPIADAGGPYAGEAEIIFDGSASTDPQGDTPLTYEWNFGDPADPTTGTGAKPTHTYSADGSYTVTLVVTDSKGSRSAPATTTVVIGNVPPVSDAGPELFTRTGVSVTFSGSFTDYSASSPWSYTIDWGDGTASATGQVTSPGPVSAPHTYPTEGDYTVTLSVTDARGASSSDQTVVKVRAPGAAITLLAAGDIASCSARDVEDELTARIIDAEVAAAPDAILFTLGDNAYPNGRSEDYANCYHPTWGRHKARTWANLGNHEYDTGTATASFDYFGERAGPRDKGYYSIDIGQWHVVVLNDNKAFVPFAAGSEQDKWLQADLAANTKRCTLAIFHQPMFYSNANGSSMKRTGWKILWDRLWAGGTEIILNGHHHFYERFAPMKPDGSRDDISGIREFIVGTGGESVYLPSGRAPNSQAIAKAFGILKLSLGDEWYEWQFKPVTGGTFTDSGAGTCR